MDKKSSEAFGNANGLEVAVIGMSYRFPQASNIGQLWRNLKEGVEAISFFSEQEVEDSGIDPNILKHPRYVRAWGIIEGAEYFDAKFFGYSPREAEIIDPQQRLFLECAWEALEHAGYDSEKYDGLIGVYGGASMNSYLLNLLMSNNLQDIMDPLQVVLGNDKDYLTTRVSYKLNLEGPSITVQSACSTSLVAIHLAYQALLSGECDMALAGASSVRVPQKAGYYSPKGGILSPDGRCRVFDANAQGTVRGNGVGIVVLKRLADAIRDADNIYAVIKGSSINNDGSSKLGFTAPRAAGQAKVIRTAHLMADINPETITYVEAHGTGTELGDPIEVEALTEAFRAGTEKKNFCAIGSIKSNIGHLDATAGVAGFIKTALALKHQLIPPSLNFERANPQIDFDNSPFFVNTSPIPWPASSTPRRAGVSSFGMGGTNAHIVLEEAPPAAPSGRGRPVQLLALSAKTATALEAASRRLAEYLSDEGKDQSLGDVAYTLGVGRREFDHRRVVVCRDQTEAVQALQSLDPMRVATNHKESQLPTIVFMFSGQGTQYPNMGRELYQEEAVFRQEVDRCAELLEPQLGLDLRTVLYPTEHTREEAAQRLNQTFITQPALFTIEYALAQLITKWGARPAALIGHSIGEYVAACLAGVFSLEEGLALVAARGRLMQSLPSGKMLSVRLPERELEKFLSPELSLAAVNGPSYCVASGPADLIIKLEERLSGHGVKCRALHTSHAFHSRMMEPILKPFAKVVKTIKLNPPQLPFLSNVSGAWITAAEATDSNYWVIHLRQTVRFESGVRELSKEPGRILLEVGPGDALCSLAKLHWSAKLNSTDDDGFILSSLPHAHGHRSDLEHLLATFGRLWLSGLKLDWPALYAGEQRRRTPLPTYPFERQRYCIEPARQTLSEELNLAVDSEKPEAADSAYLPVWRQSEPKGALTAAEAAGQASYCLVFIDPAGLGAELARRLEERGSVVRTVAIGSEFKKLSAREYVIDINDPNGQDDFYTLLHELRAEAKTPTTGFQPGQPGQPEQLGQLWQLWHLWSVTAGGRSQSQIELLDETQRRGFYSLLRLAQAIGKEGANWPIELRVVTNSMQPVGESPVLYPAQATVLGPCRTISTEYPRIACQSIDIVLPSDSGTLNEVVDQLVGESATRVVDPVIAYRQGKRFVQTFESLPWGGSSSGAQRLREQGAYLLTGGLGGIGLALAEDLARKVKARLILVSRSTFPPKERWEQWLAAHGDGDEVSRKIRRLRAIEDLGSELMVASADVADAEQMRMVIQNATAHFGSINGVIHSAGAPGDGVIQLKTSAKAAAVLDPKLKGALVLESLLEGVELDFFVLCSSLTAIQSQLGQVDYCGANAFLDAFAHHYAARTGRFAVSINWDRWNEVGMAVEAERRYGVKNNGYLSSQRAIGHPLFDRCITAETDREVYETMFSSSKYWLLDEHRIMKRAILPGTVYLEMARALIEGQADKEGIEIRDVTFLNPMTFGEGEQREARTIVIRQGDLFNLRFLSRPANGNGASRDWHEHARLKVAAVALDQPRHHDIAAILQRCRAGKIDPSDKRFDGSKQKESPLYLGPRWQIIKDIHLGTGEAVASLELAEEFLGDLEKYRLHPSLLDVATSAVTSDYMRQSGREIYLPLWYKRLRINAPFTRRIFSHIKHKNQAQPPGETIVRDIIITDEEGRVLVEIEDFTLKRVPDEIVGETAPFFASSPADDRRLIDEKPLSAAANPGLSSSAGVAAFNYVLAQAHPQVIISTLPLRQRLEEMKALRGTQAFDAVIPKRRLGKMHPRPTLASQYVAPRNQIERAVCQVWQDVLGIEQIGIYDNFFELGGNSLMGIELVAEVSKAFGVEIPVVGLYEGSTVSSLAQLLAKDEKPASTLDERRARGDRRRAKKSRPTKS